MPTEPEAEVCPNGNPDCDLAGMGAVHFKNQHGDYFVSPKSKRCFGGW